MRKNTKNGNNESEEKTTLLELSQCLCANLQTTTKKILQLVFNRGDIILKLSLKEIGKTGFFT